MDWSYIYIVVGCLVATYLLLKLILLPMMFRKVVSTNDIHIVQTGKRTISYGKDQEAGNAYYAWPAWMPGIGVRVTSLPSSVFKIQLDNYAAYDKDRLPFMIDIIGFFLVADSNVASARVTGMEDLLAQLKGILQGAIRSILASSEISTILEGRAEFGNRFTQEVDGQLKEWGIRTVKNIELMDIRDADQSAVIKNIMAMKKSDVESKSRIEVAKNMQLAKEAEIAAEQAVNVKAQDAAEAVNVRTAAQQQATEVAAQKALQAVAIEKATTAEKDMITRQVNEVKQAEITKQVMMVTAEQQKSVAVTNAEGQQKSIELVAQGNLAATKLQAEGVLAQGTAKAESERLLLMAPVSAQLQLAEKIGANDSYQKYLVTVRGIEKDQAVGIEQAKALDKASIKIIAQTGSAIDGIKSAADLFSAKGGTSLGAAIEAFAASDIGKGIVDKISSSNGAGAAH